MKRKLLCRVSSSGLNGAIRLRVALWETDMDSEHFPSLNEVICMVRMEYVLADGTYKVEWQAGHVVEPMDSYRPKRVMDRTIGYALESAYYRTEKVDWSEYREG